MPPIYEIKFLPSGQTRAFHGSRGNSYELEDGTRLDVRSGPVWCRRCADFTDGESIESLDEIDRQIADLRDPTSELYQFFQDGVTGSIGVDGIHLIMALEQRRRWREGRRSPPKCLECGMTEIVRLPDGEIVLIPTGPGWVEVTITGHCSTWFNNVFYTPEGARIPRDTKPTYWSLP